MHASALPSGLWDLTVARLSFRAHSYRPSKRSLAHSARSSAQAALAHSRPPAPPPVFHAPNNVQDPLSRRSPDAGALTPRRETPTAGGLAKLEERITALKEAANSELLAVEAPFYSEDELLAMYEELLAHNEPVAVPAPGLEAPRESARSIVLRMEEQLAAPETVAATAPHSPLIEKLRRSTPATVQQPHAGSEAELHRRVLEMANTKLQLMGVLPSSSTAVGVPLFTMEEYKALTRLCIEEGDIDAAESVLALMKRSGLVIPEESLSLVLRQYSDIGNATGADYCLANFLQGRPTDAQRHLHVRAHLRATPTNHIPETALTVLHSYETQSCPAPMKTYTSIISALYSTNISLARAQAWDLFSHMRYVAHPTPDVVLYTQMIRACASPVSSSRSSDPERALDLWTEMTVEQKLTPTVGSFNAIILACARSGRKLYVNEAFRIAKQMLDSNRDAYGNSAYHPDRGTIIALLEGAKRMGDLARTRWILADMVASNITNPDEAVNEEVMMHVFQTYASYVPPFTRYLARVKGVGTKPNNTQTATVEAPPPKAKQHVDVTARFTHIPPQTANEVLEEVDALFQQIGESKFGHVRWSPRLVNSFLSIHYQHSSLETAAPLFWSTFKAVRVEPDARCYVEAIERCGRGKKGREREVGLEFVDQLWEAYHKLETSRIAARTLLDARLVERAHGGYIRALAFHNQLPRAMDQLRLFVRRYPAHAVRQPSPLLPFRSTRTVLIGARPLVRLTTPVEVPDDDVPPFLRFDDLELLHHRLVATHPVPKQDIGYLKYVCKAYEWALRGRRNNAFQAEAPRPGPSPAELEGGSRSAKGWDIIDQD
ncbi:hypothetical protein HMN09_00195500 [Mycena chlorophos]|uniref:Pentacotripeptide-repeat region of PRORP domain-containing protein n=1 Tax=Mycena chlorophos TaxID=658473 RepID=A0A8H6TPQ3_MYCCL|nr:hypothetical protein HMN09_00195500 [Mycena chlorophos]